MLVPYLFIIVVDYVMRTSLQGGEDKLGFQLRKRKSRRVPLITVHILNDIKRTLVLEKISTKRRRRFLKFAGHCLHRDDEVVTDLFWELTHGTRRRGRPLESYLRNLERETGIPASDMRVAMKNSAVWRTFAVRETTIQK